MSGEVLACLPDLAGNTPLHIAATVRYHGVKVARLLIAAGGRLTDPNKAGELPLHLAARLGRLEFVTFFVDFFTNPEGKEGAKEGVEGVERADGCGNPVLDIQSAKGDTALILAACHGKERCAKVLTLAVMRSFCL
jgi:ankyrin repeat protein